MNPITNLIIAVAVLGATSGLAQNPTNKPYHAEKPAGTNMALTGILLKETGTVVNLGPGRSIIELGSTKTNGEQITIYRLVTPDGTRVGFGRQTIDTAPAKLDDFVNQSCTIQGICTVMEARPGLGRLINFDQITRITKDAVPPTAEQLEAVQLPGLTKHVSTNLTCSGILTKGTASFLGANKTTTDEKFTVYTLAAPDGTKAVISSAVAEAAPVKPSGFIDESVTIHGTGTESGSGPYRRINIDKVTRITLNAPTAAP